MYEPTEGEEIKHSLIEKPTNNQVPQVVFVIPNKLCAYVRTIDTPTTSH